MKIAIIYKSITGNTKNIAEAIKSVIKKEELVYFGEPTDNINADLYIVGSWTDKGMCTKEIAEYLQKLNNTKIAYFGTAGFGGSTEYYQKLFDRIKANINDSNEILGAFFCQGKMPISVRERYVQMIQQHPDDKNLQVSIQNFDDALTHPDSNDIDNAKKWISTLINS